MHITVDMQVKTDLLYPSMSRSHLKIILFEAFENMDIFPLGFGLRARTFHKRYAISIMLQDFATPGIMILPYN